MRRFAPWLLLLVAMSGGLAATYARCPGCIDRDRVNRTCEWTGDTPFPLDSQNPAHQQHLIADAQLAEELAVRYADAEKQRRVGGTACCGGLLDHGRVRNDCMAHLVDTIEKSHAVTAEQVQVARGQRNRTFDLAVGLLFFPLYSFGVTIACHRLRLRFSSDQRSVQLVATGLASVAVSLLGLPFGQLWLMVWEAVRVGNGHMSTFRAASYDPWPHEYLGVLFAAGVLQFWLIALLGCRTVLNNGHISADVRGADGILLR